MIFIFLSNLLLFIWVQDTTILISLFQTYAGSTQNCKYSRFSSVYLWFNHLNQQVELGTYDGKYRKETDISTHSGKHLSL